MAISKDEIDKYIFDPENPKQCKSYKLLLRIAKSENNAFLSSAFWQYFLGQNLLNGSFREQLWDEPENYSELSFQKKVNLFIEQLSELDFKEYVDKLDEKELPLYNIFKYKFLNINFLISVEEEQDFIKKIKFFLFENEDSFSHFPYYEEIGIVLGSENKHLILFMKNNFQVLKADIQKSSICITLEENINQFLEYENNNVKPIFLKKIEDVKILLDVLQKDIQQEEYEKNIINSISIKNFFSIESMKLNNLKNKKEIYIVGENGDGKTLLLQAIAVGLKGTQEDGLKEFRVRENEFIIEIENKKECKNSFLAYGSSRNNSCQIEEDKTGYLSLFSGKFDLKSPTKWLQYLDYSEQKENNNVITVVEAKKLLQELLNSDIEIDINPDKVTFTEKGSEVSFSQLSAGYRGVIIIICDMISRLSEKQQVANIKDFQGIVLIDEVELHLHPKWQYSFMNKLREIFPLIQFMVTTHSPTVLLGASMDAVYYQIYKDDGVVKISKQKEVKNDFLNDIQSDIFGFDVNNERINNPTDDDKKRQKRAKENLLNLIDTIEKGE